MLHRGADLNTKTLRAGQKADGPYRRSIAVRLSILALAGFLASSASASDETARERFGGELERWEFAGGGEFGVYGASAEGSATGGPITGPRASNVNTGNFIDGPDTVIEDLADSNDLFSLLMGASFSVMTPALFDVQTHPRLFLDVSILGVATLESPVVREGDPGEFALPTDASFQVPVVGEPLVFGTGTQISSQQQDYQLHAGLGVALTVDAGENRFRIKPSLMYSRTRNQVSAVTHRAVRLREVDPPILGATPPQRDRSLDGYRLLRYTGDQTEVYHAVGGGLEIEYLTHDRFGPFALSLFARGGATYILGDRETTFFRQNPEYPEESVFFRYKNDPWSYRVTTGIRLRFSPGGRD
jgi:hypothetical protein